MAAELNGSGEAVDDIDAIAQFITGDSLHHAQAVLHGRRLLESTDGRFE